MSSSLLRVTVWANLAGTLDFSIPLVLLPSDTLAVAQHQAFAHASWRTGTSLPCVPAYTAPGGGTGRRWGVDEPHSSRVLAWGTPGSKVKTTVGAPASVTAAARMYVAGRQVIKSVCRSGTFLKELVEYELVQYDACHVFRCVTSLVFGCVNPLL